MNEMTELQVAVDLLSPRGVITLFLRDKPETDMREIAADSTTKGIIL